MSNDSKVLACRTCGTTFQTRAAFDVHHTDNPTHYWKPDTVGKEKKD